MARFIASPDILFVVLWFCGFVVLWFCGFVVLWFCGYLFLADQAQNMALLGPHGKEG
jgi:hypothetical protein